MTKRVFNFSAGPAVLPLPVLEKAQAELTALPGVGSSVMEISHRGKDFIAINEKAEADVCKVLDIPDDYRVLFLQGGSRLQFSMVPMNLLRGSDTPADYILTGSWGKKALGEAKKEGPVNIAWDAKETNYDRVPAPGEAPLRAGAPYIHITTNETIEGVQFPADIDLGDAPLVADCSSDIFCRPTPISKYGLIYACAQKNAGPAGVTVVIIRKDLLEKGSADLPGYLNYKNHADNDSCYNTPCTFGIYMVGLIAQWLLEDIGGLARMEEINCRKAKMLYDVIDGSGGFYNGHAAPESRSIMNVTFRLPSDQLQAEFIKAAGQHDLKTLKGHRSVGGIRASIYNAMPEEGVVALREFMKDFCAKNG